MALAKGEPKRLEIRGPSLGKKSYDVLVDGREIGRIETHDEALEGRSFPLGDGTTLTVRLEPVKQLLSTAYRVRVERDGALLRDSPGHPVQVVRQGAAALWFVGGLTALFGAVIAFGSRNAEQGPYGGIGMALEGGVFLGFAFAASREKRWALIAGLSLYALETLFSLTTLGAGGWMVRAAVITALVRAISAHGELDRVDAASVADVFR